MKIIREGKKILIDVELSPFAQSMIELFTRYKEEAVLERLKETERAIVAFLNRFRNELEDWDEILSAYTLEAIQNKIVIAQMAISSKAYFSEHDWEELFLSLKDEVLYDAGLLDAERELTCRILGAAGTSVDEDREMLKHVMREQGKRKKI
jgi:hypothetical protein